MYVETWACPPCQNPERCKIYKCQFKHFVPVDDESDSDSDSDTIDNENDPIERKENDTNPVRCDYGLCDFQRIFFESMSDFKVHLRNHHGIERWGPDNEQLKIPS